MEMMKPPTFGAVISKSASGKVRLPGDLDLAVGELRLGRDLDRLRHAVEGQVADERHVGRRAGDGRRRDVDRLGQHERRGRELVGLEALGPQPVVAAALVRGDRRRVDRDLAGGQLRAVAGCRRA